MRSSNGWYRRPSRELSDVWPADLGGFPPAAMLAVELGLYLLLEVMPDRTAADAWTLFGGYPYGEALGYVRTGEQRLRIRRARHYLWPMRRRRVWLTHLESYLKLPPELRGYDLKSADDAPARRSPARAAGRFEVFGELLSSPPEFVQRRLPLATAGEYRFRVRDRNISVTFDAALASGPPAPAHDLADLPAGRGEPITATWAELEDAAREMDGIEAGLPSERCGDWANRLSRVKLFIRQADGFTDGIPLAIAGMLHLVGMVGAGKSTLRDVLAYWCATKRGLRVTIVVGDVAEVLAVVGTLIRLGVPAAPILGQTTRERHIQRLHRRLATAGAPAMLAHDHPGFRNLSSGCAVDALRGLEADRPLRVGQAPCTSLYSTENEDDRSSPHGCPLWSRCPRHHGARDLVTAQVWVATPASLVHSAVPPHQTEARIRYLELACRTTDLVIVDEADRVQMQLDAAFAPSTTLVGRAPDSWLDEVQSHKISELARQGRLQLSEQEIDDWTNAVNTVSTAADRLYALLIQNKQLRDWVVADYFSAFTLHQWLLNTWFPELSAAAGSGRPDEDDPAIAAATVERDRVSAILDAFRDDPLQAGEDTLEAPGPAARDLVHLTLELLHAHNGATTRDRLRRTLLGLLPDDTRPAIESELDTHTLRFEFTLILAALHHRLDFMTGVWPRVEAALNLDGTSNVLSRRPPRDYEPLIPESPMGNILGFQFQLDDGGRSGALRFFRCSGVGRELLLGLHELPCVDGRPGPNVLLMSATSWAGTSSRYHVHLPVGAVLRPNEQEVDAILRTTFRKEFLYSPDGYPLRLSGAGVQERPLALRQMLRQLAEPDRSLVGSASKLAEELADIPDPDRRRLLLLVGSYAEAREAADYLGSLPEWAGRVAALISDDADLDDAWAALPGGLSSSRLRRGDGATVATTASEILVAPLLAVERGHNIVLDDGKAAIGTVYFLVRPHPRPDDITLAIQAVNDWAVRCVRDGGFAQQVRAVGTPDAAGLEFRRLANKTWQRYLTRRLSWSSLPEDEKVSFTWDQLVVMWQVIGRLVRGGVPARVVFVDAAFSPREAGLTAIDTPATSLLLSIRQVLSPYFTDDSDVGKVDRSLVRYLYEPLYQALADLG